jgi:hypothetical protein
VQAMQPPTRCVHVILGLGVVQRSQLRFQFIRVLRLNFRLRPCFEERARGMISSQELT